MNLDWEEIERRVKSNKAIIEASDGDKCSKSLVLIVVQNVIDEMLVERSKDISNEILE
jgi:hypothetical protein